MKYYKSAIDDKLIQFNPETKVYKTRNYTEKINPVLTLEEFNLLNPKEVKKQEFCRLMNEYYKNVKHSWEYEGKKFRKLDNFEAKNYSLSANYDLGKDVPYHDLSDGNKWHYKKNLILVYHWDRIYYHTISYGGYKQGQLLDPKTLNGVRWAQLKHCAPIFDVELKKII